jgi:hypothetical protein
MHSPDGWSFATGNLSPPFSLFLPDLLDLLHMGLSPLAHQLLLRPACDSLLSTAVSAQVRPNSLMPFLSSLFFQKMFKTCKIHIS